jgi:hypothetical protein
VRHLIERYLAEHVPRLAPDSASDYRSMTAGRSVAAAETEAR